MKETKLNLHDAITNGEDKTRSISLYQILCLEYDYNGEASTLERNWILRVE